MWMTAQLLLNNLQGNYSKIFLCLGCALASGLAPTPEGISVIGSNKTDFQQIHQRLSITFKIVPRGLNLYSWVLSIYQWPSVTGSQEYQKRLSSKTLDSQMSTQTCFSLMWFVNRLWRQLPKRGQIYLLIARLTKPWNRRCKQQAVVTLCSFSVLLGNAPLPSPRLASRSSPSSSQHTRSHPSHSWLMPLLLVMMDDMQLSSCIFSYL